LRYIIIKLTQLLVTILCLLSCVSYMMETVTWHSNTNCTPLGQLLFLSSDRCDDISDFLPLLFHEEVCICRWWCSVHLVSSQLLDSVNQWQHFLVDPQEI